MCTKTCSKCGETKEVSEFIKHRTICKNCYLIQQKEYYSKNKDRIKQNKKQYYLDNKEEYTAKQRILRATDKRKEYAKKYREENKERIKLYHKENYIKNIDQIKLRNKLYTSSNRHIVNARIAERKKVEPIIYIKNAVHNSVRRALIKNKIPKNSPTQQILGCTYKEFVRHLEDNKYGFTIKDKGLDIDHIIPIHTAKTEEEVIKLSHYTNFQLLPSDYNRYIKSGNEWDAEHFHQYYFNSI